MDEPKLRVYMQEAMRPAPSLALRPGRWAAEPGWPPPELSARKFALVAAEGHGGRPGMPADEAGAEPGGPGNARGRARAGGGASNTGQRYSVEVRLGAIAYVVPAGHRLRLAVSPTYWPWAWPSPEPVTLTVVAGPGPPLDLPLRTPPGTEEPLAPHFSQPEAAPSPPYVVLEPVGRSVRWSVTRGPGLCE
jgi:predicted acyl esterase